MKNGGEKVSRMRDPKEWLEDPYRQMEFQRNRYGTPVPLSELLHADGRETPRHFATIGRIMATDHLPLETVPRDGHMNVPFPTSIVYSHLSPARLQPVHWMFPR
jgi:hypothetical protein